MNIVKHLYPKPGGPRIDMWKEQSYPGGKHVFGYWPDGSKASATHPPTKTLSLSILENGNYPGNPQPKEFYQWIGKARKNPEIFNYAEYTKVFKGEGQ